jgi:transposase
MKDIKVLGIDLAKNVFQLHGADARGKRILSKRMGRMELIEFMSNLAPCLVGIEACTGAHYWARLFRTMGHTVKMMAPQFVKPYVMSNKNDKNDAKGIAEAVTRPEMKFVPIKTVAQQDILLLHRARELSIKNRTSQSNQVRGLLAEYGVVINKGLSEIRQLPEILELNKDKLSRQALAIFQRMYEQFKDYDVQVNNYEKDIEAHVKSDPICKEIIKIEGIGPISASALVASIGDAKAFKNGREVSAWLGLVPKQHSSGNKIRLSGISKRGDRYLRYLLIHGARSALRCVDNKMDKKSRWAFNKRETQPFNKVAVALANKNARIVWAIMATGECYRHQEVDAAA